MRVPALLSMAKPSLDHSFLAIESKEYSETGPISEAAIQTELVPEQYTNGDSIFTAKSKPMKGLAISIIFRASN